MNRGARKQRIFWHAGDRAYFLALVAELPERFGVEVHGYALMPNHYHLMLRTPQGNLSQAMRWLQQVWTQRVNRVHGWDGALFRGRFRNCVADSDVYWGHLFAYLHLNPVRSEIVGHPDQARWTSHGPFVGTAPRPDWLTTNEMEAWYGSIATYRAYLDDVRQGRRGHPEGFARFASWEAPTGIVTPVHRRSPPRMSEAEALRLIESITGRPFCSHAANQGKSNAHASFSAWVLHRAGGLSQSELARRWDVSQPTVAKRIQAFETRHHGDPVLWTWTNQLDAVLFERLRVRRSRAA